MQVRPVLVVKDAEQGIRVNAVGSGAVVTPIIKARAEASSHILLGRPACLEGIASVFAFLASDDSSYGRRSNCLRAFYAEFRVA